MSYSDIAIFESAPFFLFKPMMSQGVVANNEEAEKLPPSPAEHKDAAAAEPAFADQSTRLLPASKIVIVSHATSISASESG